MKWKIGMKRLALAKKIADRATPYLKHKGVCTMDLLMAIVACHVNGCKLDLQALSKADDAAIVHDVGGIMTHIDQDTGKLRNCFRPRFAL
jgi:hypothetical protein